MRFQDNKLQNLVNTAIAQTVASESEDIESSNYEALENACRKAHKDLVDYCLSIMPKAIASQVENSKLFAAKIIDKYVYSQI